MALATTTFVLSLLSASHQYGVVSASSLHGLSSAPIDIRALPNSPSGGYAPANVTCPSTRPTIRSAASGLSQSEQDFLDKRRSVTAQAMTDFLTRANIANFDASSYLSSNGGNTTALPTIAIAMSGGGYRALMNGAGFIAAADNRTSGATGQGGIGGLLQATTYVAGLSGAGWLVGSIYSNNFSTVEQLRDSPNIWNFENSVFSGPKSTSGIGVLSTLSYWTDVHDQVDAKATAGFNTSVTDYWGRALSYQLIDAPNGGPTYTWSSIALDQNLINGNIPMPLVVTDGRDPGVTLVSLNATNYEIGPWEMGTWDPTVYGFAPTQYVGSNFSAGEIPQGSQCVEGFDQAGYVMGTSSSLFNEFLTANISQYADIPSIISDALTAVLTEFG